MIVCIIEIPSLTFFTFSLIQILEEQLERHGDAGRLLQPFVESVLADIRERLIFSGSDLHQNGSGELQSH